MESISGIGIRKGLNNGSEGSILCHSSFICQFWRLKLKAKRRAPRLQQRVLFGDGRSPGWGRWYPFIKLLWFSCMGVGGLLQRESGGVSQGVTGWIYGKNFYFCDANCHLSLNKRCADVYIIWQKPVRDCRFFYLDMWFIMF